MSILKKETTFFNTFREWWLFTPANPSPPESATFVSTFSLLHQYLLCVKYLAVTYINTRNGYEKRKCMILYFLEDLNINQNVFQDIKKINRQDVRVIRIQIIRWHFT